MNTKDIAAQINAKSGRNKRNDHLSSIRFWLAFAAEHPAPNGENYRLLEHKGQTSLSCWSDADYSWFPARTFGQCNYPKLYGAKLP